MTVSVLFVDPGGPYPRLGVECYDEARDARTFDLRGPVVAHPPCGPWGELRHLCTRQAAWCAPWAVDVVRMVGGVLEHPAHSRLWAYCGLPRPGEPRDVFGGRSIEVEQVRWGHVARKRTWLYFVRCEPGPIPPPREPTHWIGGMSSTRSVAIGRGPRSGRDVRGMRAASSAQARRTPPAFAAWLIAAAASVRA